MRKVSIIILYWNNEKYLLRCLKALEQQTFSDFEILVIDNGSKASLPSLDEKYPELCLKISRQSSNLGFAVANNIGAHLARGQWLALLNADAFPGPGWLENLVKVSQQYPNAFFASRQIQANSPEYLDGEGDVYHISGLAWRRNYGLPVEKKKNLEEVFSSCAAAALYPRQAFLDVGGFDEDFFSYQEDVDLGFRLRLQGLRCYYVPQAVVYHIGSASTGKHSDFAIYYGHRNLVWTYVKNMPGWLFWFFLPLHLVANMFTLLRFFITGHGRAIWLAKFDAVKGLGAMLRKRKHIQRNREVSVTAIYQIMERNLLAPLCVPLQRRRFGSD